MGNIVAGLLPVVSGSGQDTYTQNLDPQVQDAQVLAAEVAATTVPTSNVPWLLIFLAVAAVGYVGWQRYKTGEWPKL